MFISEQAGIHSQSVSRAWWDHFNPFNPHATYGRRLITGKDRMAWWRMMAAL